MPVKGARELIAALEQLEPRLRKKVLRQAMREAARPMHAKIKADLPANREAAKRALKIRSIKRTRRGTVGVVIIMHEGFFGGEYFYPPHDEYGTSNQPALGTMRRGYDVMAPWSLRVARQKIAAGVEREAAALRKV